MKERGPEALGKEIMRPEGVALLDEAGLTESDIKIIRDFHDGGFSALIHGSLMKGELKDISDVDFALIGDFSKIPHTVREEFIPDITDEQLSSVDYFSIGMISVGGRKMSLHIEKEEFRLRYPNNAKPYAREYRPAKNMKIGGPSRYLLCGFSAEGASHIFRVTCLQEQLAHGVINTIPQTGTFLFEETLMAPEHDQTVRIPVTSIDSEMKAKEKLMVLGLEFDKMRADRSLYHGEVSQFMKYPMERTKVMANEFLGGDSQYCINESFALLEKYRYKHKAQQ